MFLLSALSRLPLSILYHLATFLSFVAYRLVRYRVRVVRRNVALCFPALSPTEQERIVRRFYRHFADIVVEALWFGGCRKKERLHRQRLVEIVNLDDVNALCSGGRSMMILASHFGNWELSGGIRNYNYTDAPMPFTEQNYIVVYKALTSKRWDDFMRHNRTAPLDAPDQYEGCLESREVLRYIVSHSQQQKFYVFITDQRPYKGAKGSLPVTFMGQQCKTMAAAAHLAQRFGCSVVYQRMRCPQRGHYTIEYVPICQDASNEPLQNIMDRYYELLSSDVLAQPEQYLWTHRRFV